MWRFSRNTLFTGWLGILTLIVLVGDMPAWDDIQRPIWLFFVLLVGLLLNLGTRLDQGTVSSAPTGALMAYLTIGMEGSSAAALWSVAVGALVGNVIWTARTLPELRQDRTYRRLARMVIISTAQLALGSFVSGWAYIQFGGRLPLDRLENADALPLAAFVTIYLAVYLGIFIVQARLTLRHGVPSRVQPWEALYGIILLPLPFAVLGAVAYHELSQLAFGILIVGLLIVVVGVHLLSLTQTRYRQQVLELSALSAISQAMRTNMDLNALLNVVYEQIAYLLNADHFTVALFDSNRNMLYFPLNIHGHQPIPLAPREFENGLIEHVVRQKSALLILERVPQRARALNLTPPPMPVYSWLGVPLLVQDRVLGCMVVHSSNPAQRFTDKDLHLLTTIAGQTGTAADNAQLYGQARDRAMQLATLNNVATILSGTLDVQQVLELVGSSAVAVASCDAVAIYMWWEGIQRPLSLARQNGLSEAFDAAPIMLELDDLHRRRQPLVVTDVQSDQRTGALRPAMEREGKRAWAEFLLRKGDDLLGVLVFFYAEPRLFSSEEIELLRNFTNQAGLAISNARLYTQTDATLDRRVEQLSALAEIGRELTSTLNLPGLFRLVLDRALEATQSRTGALLLRVDESNVLPAVVAHRGFAPGALDSGDPLVGCIADTYKTGQPTLIPDVTQEAGYVVQDEDTRAQLNVPVMRGSEVLGVISLGSDRPNAYSPDDLSFVTQLATQARIAIDNARLFRNIEVARDRLQIILDSMKEAIILISAEGYIALANPRVQRLLGLDPQRIINVPLRALIANQAVDLPERMGFRRETLLNVMHRLQEGHWEDSSRDGGRITFQVVADKTRFIDRTDAPVRDEAGRAIGLLMVFSDVTEERELAQAREDLGSMIVHDLRGPLTAVTTSLKLLTEIAPQDDPLGRAVKQTTETSSRAVRKLLNLVDSLLDISKLESGVINLDREPSPLLALCLTIVDELSPLARELEVDLRLDVSPDLPLLFVDTEKIERVVLNLLDNAIKFTPSGGMVGIQAYPPGTQGAPEEFVRVDVRDTGPGIPDEHKERLFDRFAQLDGQRGRRRGTGLGLTFCRLAIEAHGGCIWVEDNPQGGAVFAFTLPVGDVDAWEAAALDEDD